MSKTNEYIKSIEDARAYVNGLAEKARTIGDSVKEKLAAAEQRKAENEASKADCLRSGDVKGFEKASAAIIANSEMIEALSTQLDELNRTAIISKEEKDNIDHELYTDVQKLSEQAINEIYAHVKAIRDIVENYQGITFEANRVYETLATDVCHIEGASSKRDYRNHRLLTFAHDCEKNVMFDTIRNK